MSFASQRFVNIVNKILIIFSVEVPHQEVI